MDNKICKLNEILTIDEKQPISYINKTYSIYKSDGFDGDLYICQSDTKEIYSYYTGVGNINNLSILPDNINKIIYMDNFINSNKNRYTLMKLCKNKNVNISTLIDNAKIDCLPDNTCVNNNYFLYIKDNYIGIGNTKDKAKKSYMMFYYLDIANNSNILNSKLAILIPYNFKLIDWIVAISNNNGTINIKNNSLCYTLNKKKKIISLLELEILYKNNQIIIYNDVIYQHIGEPSEYLIHNNDIINGISNIIDKNIIHLNCKCNKNNEHNKLKDVIGYFEICNNKL